jgi:hypothetical protein
LLETEAESVVIAGWMTAALTRIGAPLDIVGAFGRIVEDEVRHVDIVSRVLLALGEQPSLSPQALPPNLNGLEGEAACEEVLAGLMAFFCISEELSGHLFRTNLTFVKDPVAKWAVSEIFRDEAMHGPFGFETAKALAPRLSAAAKARIATRLVAELSRWEKRLGGPLRHARRQSFSEQEHALSALGVLPAEVMLSVFYEMVEKEVIPRLLESGFQLDLKAARQKVL